MMSVTRSFSRRRQPSFRQVLRLVRALGPSERETIEMLLDEQFVRTVLKRGSEVGGLRKKGKLLSLEQIRKAIRQ